MVQGCKVQMKKKKKEEKQGQESTFLLHAYNESIKA